MGGIAITGAHIYNRRMKVFQVDAFSDEPFKGNPAAVCLMDGERPDEWMQNVAMEMNLSETAFVKRREDGFDLRWFTPVTEVSLCGHATLASAHALWEDGAIERSRDIVFHTKSGALGARWAEGWIELDFPAKRVERVDEERRLSEALGIFPSFTGRFETPTGRRYLLEVGSEEEVTGIHPDFTALKATDARAVMVTCRSRRPPFDFISRFFAPGVGVNEDPVTGSAHCYLAPYWAEKLGKTDLVGYQASRRSGVIGCSVRGGRVFLRGKALTVFKGELVV